MYEALTLQNVASAVFCFELLFKLFSDWLMTMAYHPLLLAGSPILSSQAMVTLRTVDQFEPLFDEPYYRAEVFESAERGQVVLTTTARVALGHPLIYTLTPVGGFFDVDRDKGN